MWPARKLLGFFFACYLFFSFGNSDTRGALKNSFQFTASVVQDVGMFRSMRDNAVTAGGSNTNEFTGSSGPEIYL
jgi:hypothetical protein